jgi:hypothetical protein
MSDIKRDKMRQRITNWLALLVLVCLGFVRAPLLVSSQPDAAQSAGPSDRLDPGRRDVQPAAQFAPGARDLQAPGPAAPHVASALGETAV